MPVIVHIDTALDLAFAGISKDGMLLDVAFSDVRDNHAAWLHITIQQLMTNRQLAWKEVDAVSVNRGPGSYTGLRVGMAAAKGFCFAANKPLITISCTQLIALAATTTDADLYCAMIDARRMEVFTAIYDASLNEIAAPHALLLDEKSFSHILDENRVVFCGNGAQKFKNICTHKHAVFTSLSYEIKHHIELSLKCFHAKSFADAAYAVPEYGKSFYSTQKK